ncbi:hypothetical protein BEE12_23430 (plasmid) [Pantoea agglomerans]|nr:hypothetical protein BEE12_23430 [Pantoea agglomerans]
MPGAVTLRLKATNNCSSALPPSRRIQQAKRHACQGIDHYIQQNQCRKQKAVAAHLTFLHGAIQKV